MDLLVGLADSSDMSRDDRGRRSMSQPGASRTSPCNPHHGGKDVQTSSTMKCPSEVVPRRSDRHQRGHRGDLDGRPWVPAH
jgi:hypothetical protein